MFDSAPFLLRHIEGSLNNTCMGPTSTTNNVAEKGTNSNMSVDSIKLNIENVTKATFILISILLSVKKKKW